MEEQRVITGFRQHDANISNDMAYYTDPQMCRMIRTWIEYPEEESYLLEPSAGNGEAVLQATGKTDGLNRDLKIFAVELQSDTASKLSEREGIDECLCSDFTQALISNSVFGGCFANPPYGVDVSVAEGVKPRRLEFVFLMRITRYLVKDGLLIWVVPQKALEDYDHAACILKNYTVEKAFRFPSPVYDQFHQSVLFLRKKKQAVLATQAQVKEFMAQMDDSTFPVLTERPEETERIPMPAGKRPHEFRTMNYDPESSLAQIYRVMEKCGVAGMGITPYESERSVVPALPLNVASKSLLLVNGVGQGFCGSEEEGNLHLQRGSTHSVTDVDQYSETADGTVIATETTHTSAYITRCEADGRITRIY